MATKMPSRIFFIWPLSCLPSKTGSSRKKISRFPGMGQPCEIVNNRKGRVNDCHLQDLKIHRDGYYAFWFMIIGIYQSELLKNFIQANNTFVRIVYSNQLVRPFLGKDTAILMRSLYWLNSYPDIFPVFQFVLLVSVTTHLPTFQANL